MKALCKRFARDESGATAIEYALVGTLISVVIVASVTALGLRVADLYDVVKNKIIVPS